MPFETRFPSCCTAFTFAAATLLTAVPAFAQTQTTGAITGRITDSSAAVITQATVQVTSRATGAQSKITTDTSGNFHFSLLAPGNYSLICMAPGFKTESPQDIAVNRDRDKHGQPHHAARHPG